MAKTVKNKKEASGKKKITKQMKNLLTLFLVGCLWETYLLVAERFYLRGTGREMLAAYAVLRVLPYVGLALAALGAVLMKKERKWGLLLLFSGLFIALSAAVCLYVDVTIFSGLVFLVPAIMLLAVVYYLYGKEFFFVACALGGSLAVLWYWRRRYAFAQYRTAGLILVLLALLALVALCCLARKACKDKGMVTIFSRRLRMLPESPDKLFLFGSFAVSFAALLISAAFGALSFYAMILLGVVLFITAVYYTVTAL